ncbi:MAG: MMPL family transporter [bacterium]
MSKMLLYNGKKWLLGICTALVAVAIVLCFFITTNYDMTQYLPEDSATAAGVSRLESSFGNEAMVQVMVLDITPAQGVGVATTLKEVDGVSGVVWLGDAVDPLTPIETIDPDLLERFYVDGAALFTVTLACGTYDTGAEAIVSDIRAALVDHDVALRGDVLDNIEARTIAQGEIFKILLIIVPICVIILMLVGRSWFEPILILVGLAAAVALNMGTNALLPNVSYITMTMAMALQLAMSLDYSLFLLHRYHEERDAGKDVASAIAVATKKTFGSITGSAATTIAGFLTLTLMDYSIGADIGIVLSKGILFSYLVVILIMPVMIYYGAPLIEKTKHRRLIPDLGKTGPGLFARRKIMVGLFLVVACLAFLLQNGNRYLYGNAAADDPDGMVTSERLAIKERFGALNPVVVLTIGSSSAEEVAFVEQVSASEYVSGVDALVTAVDSSLPREWLPAAVVDQYVFGSYSRLIVYLTVTEENEDMYAAVDFLNAAATESFNDYYLIGYAPATAEIRSTVRADATLVLWATVLAIAVIIMLVFRSVSIPIVLTLVIQAAVWINMAIAAVEGGPVLYIGYLVVTSLQLGGTVDYGILLSSRYLEFRKTLSPKEAMKASVQKSTVSIVTSSLILASAGFAEGILSAIPAVSSLGILIGRGALLSGVMILFALPSLLLVLDRPIMKTTMMNRQIRG